MKTTIDLPDALLRRVKIHAVNENKNLKTVVADFLEQGLTSAPKSSPKQKFPPPFRLIGRGPLTTGEIEAAIADGRD